MSASFTVNRVDVAIQHFGSPHLSVPLTLPSVLHLLSLVRIPFGKQVPFLLQTPWFQNELRCNGGQSNSLGLR